MNTASYQQRLKHTPGHRYQQVWAEVWEEVRPVVVESLKERSAQRGGIAPSDILSVTDALGMPFKPVVRSLERDGKLPVGTWDRIVIRGISLTRLRQQMQQSKAA
jgi:hypothetical protein